MEFCSNFSILPCGKAEEELSGAFGTLSLNISQDGRAKSVSTDTVSIVKSFFI